MTPTPPKPAIFAPELAPEGVEVRSVTFAATRPHITPRLILVHTNGAENEGTVDSAWNWSHAAPGVNTCPHYQVDRTHNGVTRARKMLATNRRGIGNATELASQGNHGNVSNWSIVVETADLGWPTAKRPSAPGGLTGFDPGQGELIATILAYESVVHDFPLEYPADWFMAGAATHTEPFGYPYWTIKKGKPCPGDAKKRDMRNWVLPRARDIVAAWTHPAPSPPPPPPPEEPMSPYLFKLSDGGLGIRDGVNGTRPLNGGEIEGPYDGEKVWTVPAGSPWEYWIRLELAVYERTVGAG